MNFQQFLNESTELTTDKLSSMKFYHGSTEKFESFKVGTGMLGDGIYFTTNKKRAEFYPKMHLRKTGNVNGIVYIYTVKLDIKNPCVFNELPITKIDSKSIRDKGYDAIALYENGILRELTVFDNKQITITSTDVA